MNSKTKWTLSVSDSAEKDLAFFRMNEKALYLKCFDLLRAILEDPENGIGKPEKLRHQKQNLYSRRISQEHRLVYLLDFKEKNVLVLSFRKHYNF